MKEKSFWHSKKFWVALVAASIPVWNRVFAIELSTADITAVVSPMIAYIIGQGAADLGKNASK
mgnify:FL=1|jgi:hypothetical protein|tara:strand:- start:299 stop:487 length:189 start_codon:yes stop_codon:yes gene_type:complete